MMYGDSGGNEDEDKDDDKNDNKDDDKVPLFVKKLREFGLLKELFF